MCHGSCVDFGQKTLTAEIVKGKRVLEVGSADRNGTLRRFIEGMLPESYLGIDIENAPGVDMICKAEELSKVFKAGEFDLIICTEVMEHVGDWKKVVCNLKHVLKVDGKILITTRSKGFAYHSSPFDFWRYELGDMKNIFSDFEINELCPDKQEPGVFIMATKPKNYKENDLSSYALYSILKRRKISDCSMVKISKFDIAYNNFLTKLRVRFSSLTPPALRSRIKKLLIPSLRN